MSKKRGQTKMIDVVRAVKQIEQYEAAEQVAETILQEMVSVVVTQEPRARARNFTAKPCSSCTARRAIDPKVKLDDNFTRVIATRGNVRYCRCSYCGADWKDIPQSGT